LALATIKAILFTLLRSFEAELVDLKGEVGTTPGLVSTDESKRYRKLAQQER
jgi:hypothetical protein